MLFHIEPNYTALLLHSDRVGLHLSQVTRVLDQTLLDGLSLHATSRHLPYHSPFIEVKRCDDSLGWTAVGEQPHHGIVLVITQNSC